MYSDGPYNATVWEHFRAPRNAGEFPAGAPRVFSGAAGARKRGCSMVFQLQLTHDARVADCRYRVYGCPAAIALCSLTSEALKGSPLAAAAAYSVVALAEQLGLPAEKRAAAITLEDAVRSAAGSYNTHMRPQATAAECTERDLNTWLSP